MNPPAAWIRGPASRSATCSSGSATTGGRGGTPGCVGGPHCCPREPQVLLLNDPASGLDPRARIEIRNLLKRLGEMNKTIIVSSHILPELADVCTRVGMIEKG